MPAGFVPASVTAVSDSRFWVLGIVPCSSPPCTSLVRTTDGGRSFVGLPTPRATLAGTSPSSVSAIRFADRQNGWVFGRSLWSTHDGGASWQRVGLAHEVIALEAANGAVWAVVADCSGSACSHYALDKSPVDSDSWTRVRSLPASGPAPSIALRGSTVGLLVGDTILVSTDGGKSFDTHTAPCTGDLGGSLVAAKNVLWTVCPTGTLSALSRSTDDGGHFTTVRGPGEQPNSAVLGAAGDSLAVLGGADGLYRTADAGGSWTKTLSTGDGNPFSYVGMSDLDVGYAVENQRALHRTSDGGKHWSTVDFG